MYSNVLTRFKQLAPLLLQTIIIFFFNPQTCRHEYRHKVTPLNVKNIKLLALLHCSLMLWTQTPQQLKWKLLMHTVFVLILNENKNTGRGWRQIFNVVVFPALLWKEKVKFPSLPVKRRGQTAGSSREQPSGVGRQSMFSSRAPRQPQATRGHDPCSSS